MTGPGSQSTALPGRRIQAGELFDKLARTCCFGVEAARRARPDGEDGKTPHCYRARVDGIGAKDR